MKIRNGIPHEVLDHSGICRNCGESLEQIEKSAMLHEWLGKIFTRIDGCTRRLMVIARTEGDV